MSIFGRMFRRPQHDFTASHIERPDDSELKKKLDGAMQRHRDAASGVVQQSRKQVRDAEMIREVVAGVLHRIDAHSPERTGR